MQSNSLLVLNFSSDRLGDLFLLRRMDEDSTSVLCSGRQTPILGRLPASYRSGEVVLTGAPIWSLSVLCSWVVCPVEELHEFSISDRSFLVSQLDCLSMSCRSAADLSVRCEDRIRLYRHADRVYHLHGFEASPPVYPETHFH